MEPYQSFKKEKKITGTIFARLIFDIRVGVIDIQIYTHFKLNLCLCWIQGKPNMYFFSSQNTRTVVCWLHTWIHFSNEFLILFDSRNFHFTLRKQFPCAMFYMHVCMYFEWWFTLNKQCDDFSIDTCNQMLLPSDTQNVLNIRLILATSMNQTNTHNDLFIHTFDILKKNWSSSESKLEFSHQKRMIFDSLNDVLQFNMLIAKWMCPQ